MWHPGSFLSRRTLLFTSRALIDDRHPTWRTHQFGTFFSYSAQGWVTRQSTHASHCRIAAVELDGRHLYPNGRQCVVDTYLDPFEIFEP